MPADNSEKYVGDLFGEIQLAQNSDSKTSLLSFAPGLLVVGVASLAAMWLSDTYGSPVILIGLLLGLALNFTAQDARLATGLDFASKTLLRWGIVLIGCRITLGNITDLGLLPFLAIVGIMIGVIVTGIFTARLIGQTSAYGVLAGGATAICGISAALAIWSILGKARVNQAQFTSTVLGVTIASAFGMTVYPVIANQIGLDDQEAGFVLGAAIHDVAQSIGGGFSFSDGAGEIATVVKLTRVTLLAPMLFVIALVLSRTAWGETTTKSALPGLAQAVPWFIALFMVIVVINSITNIPDRVATLGTSASRLCLLMAIVAAAIKSDLSGFLEYGWRAFAPVIACSAAAFALALLAAQLLA